MKIPQYWAKSSSVAENSAGEFRRFTLWRWSDTSISEAQHLADEAAQQAVLRFQNDQELNRYAYGKNPLREEIIQSVKNADGNQVGMITRNGYGALVLNAMNAMFIDIDFPDSSGDALLGLGKLFGKKPAMSPEQSFMQMVEQWASGYPDLGLRIYRTFGGLRCLVTNQVFDPTQQASLALMHALKSDPLYVTLCKQQSSFRARLTPKPWRCGAEQPPSRYPWDDLNAERQYRDWEYAYERASSLYTTCRLLKHIGANETHPDVAPILNKHDEMACAMGNLKLA